MSIRTSQILKLMDFPETRKSKYVKNKDMTIIVFLRRFSIRVLLTTYFKKNTQLLQKKKVIINKKRSVLVLGIVVK